MRGNQMIINENLKKLTRNRSAFFEYVEIFIGNQNFTGPSVHFHLRSVEEYRTRQDYSNLIKDVTYIEKIYGTLATWGMHRMGPKGAKMGSFNKFYQSVINSTQILEKLNIYQLYNLSDDQIDSISNLLLEAFRTIKVMETQSQLVGNSKALHHLLPDLIPPIDRQYTLNFFYGRPSYQNKNEEAIFLQTFREFWNICQVLDLKENDYFNYGTFSTSIPKLIDNAIIGFVRSELAQ